MIYVKVLNLSDNPDPEFETEGAAGFDIAANQDIHLPIGCSTLVSTGIKVILPPQYEGQLRLRSSMYNRGFVMPNAPGTIDSDYRGEVKVPIANIGHFDKVVKIEKGERIAQLVVKKLPDVALVNVSQERFDAYNASERGEGGFGSTGSGIGVAGL